MNRLLAMFLLAVPFGALAQSNQPDAKATQSTGENKNESLGTRSDREQLKREVMDEVRKSLEKQKDELRYEVQSQVAAQTTNRSLEEEFQFHAEKKKLELFEANGYLRVRPELYYQLDMRRGKDSAGFELFPRPGGPSSGRKTLADVNMRWRLEPTLNVSEDVRIHAQIDMLDNLILGSTPDGGYGISQRNPWVVLSDTQTAPTADRNWVNDSILVKRAYGEVNTPLGQFLFGRMPSQWGLGILTSSGSGIDSDYGDSVDRLAFVAKIAGHYVVPMLTFKSIGPTSISRNNTTGQPYDLDQLDDGHDYGIVIAKRDTESEAKQKLRDGKQIFNYGAYFTYRHQATDAVGFAQSGNPYGGDQNQLNFGFVSRNASIYIPDVWVKFQTKKLRLEFEAAAVLGSMDGAITSSEEDNVNIALRQFGAALQGDYQAFESFNVALELGFASGDRSPGLGNLPGRNGGKFISAGAIDGPQFCTAKECQVRDTDIRNFRFNRDYNIDIILWRQVLNGITDAFYVKPGMKYTITDGLDFWLNIVYSRAIYGESTPSSHLVDNVLKGDPNLGIEIDGGLRYDSGDGFLAGVSYGVLFPLAGLANNLPEAGADAKTAHAIRGWFTIKY